MKATKKIVGAACALVAAVALSAGSTFAWFASNNSVSATGLSMTVNTKSSYLIIGNSDQDTASKIRDDKGRTDLTATTFKALTDELIPVAHELPTADTNAITSANINTTEPWYTMTAKDTNKTDAKPDSKKTITTTSHYFLKDTVYLTVKRGSGDSGVLSVADVNVTAAKSESGNTVDPVCVIFVCGTNLVEFKNNGTDWAVTKTGETDDSKVLADKVVDVEGTEGKNQATQVDVYVYYDGAHASVFTDNAMNLVGATISVSFATA